MSREMLRTQLDSQRIELQRLQVENAHLRDECPAIPAEIDAKAEDISKCRAESKCLAVELAELCTMLHESRESEARAIAEAAEREQEVTELQHQLEDGEANNLCLANLE